MKFNSFEDLGKNKDSFEDGTKTPGVTEDLPSKQEETNSITKKILDTDFSKIDTTEIMDFLHGTLKENRPTMYENEIRSLYNKYIEQSKNSVISKRLPFEIGRSIMDYTSDNKIKDKLTNESTLDRSYRVFYEAAESNPEEMHNLSEWTHHLFEFVKPEVFFDTYIKIKESKVLSRYFGGSQFSQLEYNMSYCGTQKYVQALLSKIDFKDSVSCLKSSQLINLSASLADYAKNGSYSGSYEVDKEIIKGFKTEMNKPESIYLLGSKTRYIVSRLENGYHPFVHQRSVFKIAPNKFACIKNGELCVAVETDNQLSSKLDKYIEIDNQINTPPQELVDEAVRLGRNYVDWKPDRRLTVIRERMKDDLFSSMLPISENDLSLSLKNINKSQLSEYINLVGTDYRNFLEEEFQFNFSDISITEQFYFLEFIQKQTNSSILPIKEFIKKYNKDGFRTFLSIEQGGKEMGDKIISLGEKLPEDVAQKVFTKYGEIIDNVSKITEFTRTNFTKEIETNSELIKKIEETLYIKGKQLLSQTYDDINNKKEVNYEDISKQLDRINADTITTFAIFKQAVKNGEKLPIESIEGSVFSKKEAVDISDNHQNEMLELYESNWKNHPDRNFVESLKSYFKTAFTPEDNKQKNYFYTFEKDNNIRAFVRFEKQNDASFYASALNVDEASKNFGLGEAMMDEALTREAKDHILHASCRKDNPSNMRYFEKGFISRGFKKTNDTEEFDLIWDEKKNKDIKAKQKSQKELISMQNTEEIEIRKSKDLGSLHDSIPGGKSLVRCFINDGEWYSVYEKISEDYGINLGETK